MANTPEKKVKDQIKALCKKHGAYYVMPVMTGYASNGTPDFIVCHNGYFAGVEAKAGKGKPTKLQMIRLVEIVQAGGSALVINEGNIDLLEGWLEDPVAVDNLDAW
jgi:hypothetical protein